MNDNDNVCVIIPARDEAGSIGRTLRLLRMELTSHGVPHTIIVVDDHSCDNTYKEALDNGAITVRSTARSPGYGHAVRTGVYIARRHGPNAHGWVVVMTADGSDEPRDLVTMWKTRRGPLVDAVFGHRFQGASVTDYPRVKRVVNRVGNWLVALSVGSRYTDFTNPFKLYRSHVFFRLVNQSRATDFSLGMELALRFVRNDRHFVVTSTSWRERSTGRSKFKVKHVLGYLRTWLDVIL